MPLLTGQSELPSPLGDGVLPPTIPPLPTHALGTPAEQQDRLRSLIHQIKVLRQQTATSLGDSLSDTAGHGASPLVEKPCPGTVVVTPYPVSSARRSGSRQSQRIADVAPFARTDHPRARKARSVPRVTRPTPSRSRTKATW